MALPPDVLVPIASIPGIGIVLRCGPDAVLRLVAGITAIAARDDKKSRAERAMDVLQTLKRDSPAPVPKASSSSDSDTYLSSACGSAHW